MLKPCYYAWVLATNININTMKNLLTTLVLFFSVSAIFAQSVLFIPANNSLELDYLKYDVYAATLENKGKETIQVKVISKVTGNEVKGFGLASGGRATIDVESENRLLLQNNGNVDHKIEMEIKETKRYTPTAASGNYINFTLRNSSAKSIPLIIPDVMNPNLSPISNSGVSLKIGQEIFFKNKGKKYLLLTVSDEIKNGDVLDVPKILKERKKELGLN